MQKHILIFLIIFCFALTARADIIPVTVEGQATIIGGDVIQARDEALLAAKIKAVERAVGVEVTAETIYSQERQLSMEMIQKSRGFVRLYDVVSEGSRGSIYTVMIEAVVSSLTTAEEEQRWIRQNRRVLTDFAVYADGIIDQPSEAYRYFKENPYEYEFGAELLDASYKKTSKVVISGDKAKNLLEDARKGNAYAVLTLGKKYMANYVALGTFESHLTETPDQTKDITGTDSKFYWYRAKMRGDLYKIESSRAELVARCVPPREGVKGYHLDKERAKEDAYNQALTPFMDCMMAKLNQKAGEGPAQGSVVNICVRGFSDFDQGELFERTLKELRFVHTATMKNFSSSDCTNYSVVSDDPSILAKKINNINKYKVIEANQAEIKVKFTKF